MGKTTPNIDGMECPTEGSPTETFAQIANSGFNLLLSEGDYDYDLHSTSTISKVCRHERRCGKFLVDSDFDVSARAANMAGV